MIARQLKTVSTNSKVMHCRLINERSTLLALGLAIAEIIMWKARVMVGEVKGVVVAEAEAEVGVEEKEEHKNLEEIVNLQIEMKSFYQAMCSSLVGFFLPCHYPETLIRPVPWR
jgi:hypothetical protein